jgi:hypothetical protein
MCDFCFWPAIYHREKLLVCTRSSSFLLFLSDLFADRQNVPQEKPKMDVRDILDLYLAIFSAKRLRRAKINQA